MQNNRARFILFFTLVFAPLCGQAGDKPREYYSRGIHYYKEARFIDARTALEQAVELAPDVSAYHHWLGKVYGRLAEKSGIFRAMSLSRLTLQQLKTAVELDNNNIEAIKDLIEYYRQAPGFLGGSRDKAEDLARQMESLEAADIELQDREETVDS